jgi:predicted extracellular nuclease
MGDTVTGLTGNLRFSRGSGASGDQTYRLVPIIEPVFVSGNSRPVIVPPASGRLRVASFNVRNFFNDFRDGSGACFPSGTSSDCRGASSPVEFDRQLQKLIVALSALDADVIGLMELENDYPDGDNSSIHVLVDALNAQSTRCTGDYEYVVPPGGGRVGTDAIAVGLMYCGATVMLASGSSPAVLDDSLLANLGLSGPIFNGEASNRSSLAATFTERSSDQSVTIVVNHFKSKGASTLDDAGSTCGVDIDPQTEPNCDQLDGQGFWNLRRTEAALALGRWLDTHPTGVGEADILIVGDLNAYPQEDPVKTLEHLGYTDLLHIQGVGMQPYSFVFDGQAGLLDYMLGSPSVTAQTSAVGVWPINADEADALDYNLDFGRSPTIFDGTVPFRASDHDPVVIGLDLQPDTDGDGVPDGADNCILKANGPRIPDAGGNSQRDTDNDGFGNVCDPDFDGSRSVDFADLAVMKSAFFSSDPDADLDGNGSVDFSDLAIMKSLFFDSPGPSALLP